MRANIIPYYVKGAKTKVVTITVPTWLLVEIDRECAAQGRTRSNWFAWILSRELEKGGFLGQEKLKD